eukprot:CAMPEP_0181171848 /NCGR_PEP_ID=MMETSP1096-20121128/2131_1 /TAXON_ID=156174 ORGANISM="Chrysochromulina ericina, Strain CCMP281" /NCGR_SAMPLE_ID=MMETSP1096 /ASSEMBLY_ACC=CAM_ASM_000453 /LENGTH=163 /DNA_ID=CAMNT_0023259529 /DNA_START=10 /DNA_END=497 /DNA_ORIENTATION=+
MPRHLNQQGSAVLTHHAVLRTLEVPFAVLCTCLLIDAHDHNHDFRFHVVNLKLPASTAHSTLPVHLSHAGLTPLKFTDHTTQARSAHLRAAGRLPGLSAGPRAVGGADPGIGSKHRRYMGPSSWAAAAVVAEVVVVATLPHDHSLDLDPATDYDHHRRYSPLA